MSMSMAETETEMVIERKVTWHQVIGLTDRHAHVDHGSRNEFTFPHLPGVIVRGRREVLHSNRQVYYRTVWTILGPASYVKMMLRSLTRARS